MKKIFILMSFAAGMLCSCAKQETDDRLTDEIEYNAVLTAKIPETKVAIDDAYTKLSWTEGDKISVLTSSGCYREFTYVGTSGATTAEFKGILQDGESIADWAVYPANAQHGVNTETGRPSVYLPEQYEWNEGEVMGPMVAEIVDGEASFTHEGGLFAFDVKNVPAGATGFRFIAPDNDITVEMLFDELAQATDMKFYVPVPVGSYGGFTISYRPVDGAYVDIKTSTSTNVIKAATVKVFSVAIEGAVWYVTASGSAEADGRSWTTATALSTALEKAEDGDVIYVGAGTYVPDTYISGNAVDADNNIATEVATASTDAQKSFIVDKYVTILGGYPAAGGNICDPGANQTILSGNDVTNHVVLVSVAEGTGKVKMSGFTVTGAASNKTDDTGKWSINGTLLDDYSGALAVVGKSTVLDLENMKFTGNSTVNASAIYGADATVTVKDCVFDGNTASGNGTVWFNAGSNLTFSDSEISNNSAANAAGLYLYLEDGTSMVANVSNLTITGNTATSRGGAMYLRTATAGQTMNAVIDGCTISDNTSAAGASLYILNASGVAVRNSDVSKNAGTGTSEGGAFYSLDASNTFENCSFNSNTAKGNGTFLIQSNAVATINVFDECVWYDNVTTGFANTYVYGKATDNNVVITNSLFNQNSVKGRGGAIYVRTTGAGKADCKCVNTTFYNNSATSRGTAVLAYSNNANYNANVDLISCTIYDNNNSGEYEAVMAETNNAAITSATINCYNTIIEGNTSSVDSEKTYNAAAYLGGAIGYIKCQTDGSDDFDYTTMLGTLNSDGVCPLLLPDTNPAFSGGMSAEDLSNLASNNVPASVLTTDQLGNERTGNVIGACAIAGE